MSGIEEGAEEGGWVVEKRESAAPRPATHRARHQRVYHSDHEFFDVHLMKSQQPPTRVGQHK